MWCVAEILKVRNVCINLCMKQSSVCVLFVHACQGVLSWLWNVAVDLLLLILFWLYFLSGVHCFTSYHHSKKIPRHKYFFLTVFCLFPPLQQAYCWIFKHQHFHLLWLDIVILGNLNTIEVFSNFVWFDQCPSLTLKAQKKVFQAP